MGTVAQFWEGKSRSSFTWSGLAESSAGGSGRLSLRSWSSVFQQRGERRVWLGLPRLQDVELYDTCV